MRRLSLCSEFGLTSFALVIFLSLAATAQAQSSLEERMNALEQELGRLRADAQQAQRLAAQREEEMQVVLAEMQDLKSAATSAAPGDTGASVAGPAGASGAPAGSWANRVTIGGYGESHLGIREGPGGDEIDNHRVVAYLGVNFTDWIQLNTEVELEHSFVSEGAGGEVALEQLYTDFLLHPSLNLRAGRFLTPLGIVNQKHEPTTFNGVERPLLDQVLIPTTWSADGAGFFGRFGDALTYEVYVASSLDGSGFSATSGFRGGRQKERPGVNQPAVTGRVDLFPLLLGETAASDGDTGSAPSGIFAESDLRLGASIFAGGVDNGYRGAKPEVDGYASIFSGDFEWSIGDFDFRGVLVFEHLDDAADLNEDIDGNVAEWMAGYYIEAGWHVWPDAWKQGKLIDSDLVLFGRLDDVNTQYQMPSGYTKDRRGDREMVTAGFSFFPATNYVFKGDIQILDDDTSKDIPLQFNFGLGWRF